MTHADLVERLVALPNLAKIPRTELEWLVAHGQMETHEAGVVVAPKGKRIHKLWIILSGHIAALADRGAGPRRVIDWRTGQVSGMLPYSRMKGPPGDNYTEVRTELLTIGDTEFPEMTRECPTFTAYTVHLMLDRARSFTTSDLHDEKMISLGKLAAGLAHELNNPASATARGARLLRTSLAEAEEASRALREAGAPDEVFRTIDRLRSSCALAPGGPDLSPIERVDREDEIADWLERHKLDVGLAAALADTRITLSALDSLAAAAPEKALGAAVHSIAAGCGTDSLTSDIERAANRIYELVAAVKKFTYMDKLAGPESVDVEAGLRDTISVMASKTKSKHGRITLDIPPDLPPVHATGGELNQVWMNLIDNALDAIPESGHVHIDAGVELDRVVVRVVDDGPGIPADALPHIFDAFFTTKQPGQGTGLGLEITRRLLRRYHGDISVQSSPGRTEFRVSLLADLPQPAE